jgi:hypothetical protein
MDCRRCGGSGELTTKHGRPGHDRHTPYLGPWCVYPTSGCPVCYGTGVERDRENRMAGLHVHLDAEGRPKERRQLPTQMGSEQ